MTGLLGKLNVCEHIPIPPRSGTVTVPGAGLPQDTAPPAASPRWGWSRPPRRTNATEDPDGKIHRYAAQHSVRGFAAR